MSPPAPLLKFVEEELARSASVAERCVAGTLTLLRAEREHQRDLVDALARQGPQFQQRFVDALADAVRSELGSRGIEPGSAAPSFAGLELMDEARVEADIEISRAMQMIDSTAEWERRELQTFTSTLCGLDHVSEDSNPLRPIVYATALWEAAGAVSPKAALRAALLRTSAGVLAGLLKTAWAAASSRLEAQGVQPSIYRTVLLAPGAVSSRSGSAREAARAGALGALLPGMPVAEGAAGTFTTAAPGSGDSRVTELLSRLFAVIQADTRLPGAVCAVLARLQVAALRVALQDGAMLDSADHPVWKLMNRIASAGLSYPSPGDKRLASLIAFCEAIAEEISRAQVGDAAPFRRAMTRVDGFLAEQLQWQLREASGSVTGLQRAERRDTLEVLLSQRLSDQMAGVRAPAAIRRFVTTAWAKVLAESMVRFGEQAEPTPGYMKAVDDLLWSLQPPDHPQSRQRLVSLLPDLLRRLRAGMALIEMPQDEQQAVLDALMPIHAEALRPGPRAAAAPLTPEQIVQRMREEVVPEAPAPRPFSDSVIDLASMETVPADFLATDLGTPEEAARHVDALQAGERLRLFLRGRWTRVQLLWRSAKGQYLLFAGEQSGQTHSITRRALERLDAAGLVQPLEDRSLVQRAIDTLANELPLPA
jgi:hypothetical protein